MSDVIDYDEIAKSLGDGEDDKEVGNENLSRFKHTYHENEDGSFDNSKNNMKRIENNLTIRERTQKAR